MDSVDSHTQYADQTFSDVRHERAVIESSEFHGCVFTKCSFVESVFRRCRFVDYAFQHCDLSLVQVPKAPFRPPTLRIPRSSA